MQTSTTASSPHKKEADGCKLCPRSCGADRSVRAGACGADARLKVARAALHFWEEPCISGKAGSGAVFFSGCALRCVFCQNGRIARQNEGTYLSKERLAEIFLELAAQGANNINLVTAGHFLPQVVWAVEAARRQGLTLPIVYNTGSYENAEALKRLEGIVDVYLPDFKFMDPQLAKKYANAEDYPVVAKAAIAEMVRQQPRPRFSENGEELIRGGVIVRQLLLPGHVADAKEALRYLYETYREQIYLSLMSQYTPVISDPAFPELARRVTKREYARLLDYAFTLGIKQAFIQEGDVAKESFIPDFDSQGV